MDRGGIPAGKDGAGEGVGCERQVPRISALNLDETAVFDDSVSACGLDDHHAAALVDRDIAPGASVQPQASRLVHGDIRYNAFGADIEIRGFECKVGNFTVPEFECGSAGRSRKISIRGHRQFQLRSGGKRDIGRRAAADSQQAAGIDDHAGRRAAGTNHKSAVGIDDGVIEVGGQSLIHLSRDIDAVDIHISPGVDHEVVDFGSAINPHISFCPGSVGGPATRDEQQSDGIDDRVEKNAAVQNIDPADLVDGRTVRGAAGNGQSAGQPVRSAGFHDRFIRDPARPQDQMARSAYDLIIVNG